MMLMMIPMVKRMANTLFVYSQESDQTGLDLPAMRRDRDSQDGRGMVTYT